MGRARKQYRGVRAASATTIEIDFYWQGERRKFRLKKEPTAPNLAAADRFRTRIIGSIDDGTFDPRVTFPDSKLAQSMGRTGLTMNVGELLDLWLANEEKYLKHSTLNGYIKIVNGHLRPQFGTLWIGDLTTKIVRDFLDELQCSDKTKRNVLSPLRTAFDFAVERDYVDTNPVSDLRVRRTKSTIKPECIEPFTSDEISRILSAVSGQGHNLLKFAFYTGLRTSELVALDWGDVDLTTKRLRVSKALTQYSSTFEPPKTAAGDREIKLNSAALEALESQRSLTQLKGEEVFQNPRTCERWTGDQPIRKTLWEPALRKAGVRYRKPYQTRHTFASIMLTVGESVAWLSKQMGHTDVAFTLRTYARFIEDDRSDAGDRFEQWRSQSDQNSNERSVISQ